MVVKPGFSPAWCQNWAVCVARVPPGSCGSLPMATRYRHPPGDITGAPPLAGSDRIYGWLAQDRPRQARSAHRRGRPLRSDLRADGIGVADSHHGAHSSQVFGTLRLADAWRHESRRVLMKILAARLASAGGWPKLASPRWCFVCLAVLHLPHSLALVRCHETIALASILQAAIRLRLLVTSWVL